MIFTSILYQVVRLGEAHDERPCDPTRSVSDLFFTRCGNPCPQSLSASKVQNLNFEERPDKSEISALILALHHGSQTSVVSIDRSVRISKELQSEPDQ
jgi:hypothetical protein